MASVNRLRLRLLLALLAKTLFFLLQARGEAGPGWAPAEARPTSASHGAAASADRPAASGGGTDPFVRN
jgi:hypothetical protein